MVISKEDFIEDFCKYIKKILEKELPEKDGDGQPFFEDIYLKTARLIVCAQLCHIASRLKEDIYG